MNARTQAATKSVGQDLGVGSRVLKTAPCEPDCLSESGKYVTARSTARA